MFQVQIINSKNLDISKKILSSTFTNNYESINILHFIKFVIFCKLPTAGKRNRNRNKNRNNTYCANFGYKIENKEGEEITNYKNEFYKIDNIDKPIKSISAYKVQELTDFCNKLSIETINNETKKHKNKNELYESLIQYF